MRSFSGGLHDDPVEVAFELFLQDGNVDAPAGGVHGQFLMLHGAHAGGGFGRFGFGDDALHLSIAHAEEFFGREGCGSSEEFVEKHAQGVNVGSCVDVESAHFRLFRTHIGRGAYHLGVVGEQGLFGKFLVGRLGDAEVDDLGDGIAVVQGDHDVGGFDITVNDAFLMGVLDGLTNGDEEFQAFLGRQFVFVAILGDGDAPDQFHHEKGTAVVGGPGVEDFGDVGGIHHGQGLTFRFETGDDLFGVHAQLDDLQGHLAGDRFSLFGHVNGAHTTLTDTLEHFVSSDHGAGGFQDRIHDGFVFSNSGGFQETVLGLSM